MSLLNAQQAAAIKAIRALSWTKAFTIEHYYQLPPTDLYDQPTTVQPMGTQILSGDYTWREQHERRGRPGGTVDEAHLILACDLVHSGALVYSGARMVVDGVACAITSVTPYPDTGEVVATAVRIA